jgi:glycosidase
MDGRDEDLRAFYREAIAARHAHAALRSDRVTVAASAGPAIVLARGGPDDPTSGGETMLVAVNAGPDPVELSAAVPELVGRRLAAIVATGGDGPAWVAADDDSLRMRLPGRSGAVIAAA